MQQLGEMLSTSASQYINPDYYNPLPTTVRRVLFIYFFKSFLRNEIYLLLDYDFDKFSVYVFFYKWTTCLVIIVYDMI